MIHETQNKLNCVKWSVQFSSYVLCLQDKKIEFRRDISFITKNYNYQSICTTKGKKCGPFFFSVDDYRPLANWWTYYFHFKREKSKKKRNKSQKVKITHIIVCLLVILFFLLCFFFPFFSSSHKLFILRFWFSSQIISKNKQNREDEEKELLLLCWNCNMRNTCYIHYMRYDIGILLLCIGTVISNFAWFSSIVQHFFEQANDGGTKQQQIDISRSNRFAEIGFEYQDGKFETNSSV